MAGPTLAVIRQFLAREAGTFHSGTATGGSSGASSTMIDTVWPFLSSISQNSLYKDCWLYRSAAAASADKVRIINTYTSSTGTVALDNNYTNSPSGEAYEVHGILEPQTVIPLVINEGLKDCLIPVEFTFTPSSATNTRHSLATDAPWLRDPSWILKVGYLPSGSQGRGVLDPYWRSGGIRCDSYADGATVYLDNITFNTSDTVYVYALKPAYYHCAASGGSYGSQSGLSAETDTVPDTVTVEWAAYAGLMTGWRRYRANLEANDRVKMSEREAIAKFREWNPNWTDRLPRHARPVRQWGAVR